MTDSSDPTGPKSSRKRSSRTPATIDVKPTLVDNGAPPPEAATASENVSTDETGLNRDEAFPMPPDASVIKEEVVPNEPSDSVDAGAGIDAISQDDASIGSSTAEETRGSGGEPPLPPPVPPKRDGFGPLVGAGLVGGLLGAGIVLGVQALVPFGHDDRRITELEQRLASQPNVDMGALNDRVTRLERVSRVQNERSRRLIQQQRDTSANIQTLMNRPPVEAAPPQNNEEMASLPARLAALETQLQTETQAIADSSKALEQRAAEQAQRIGQQDQRIGEQVERLNEQDKQLAALSQQLTQGASEATRAGVAVVLADQLAEALRNGTPYGDTLEALRKIQPDGVKLQALETFAARGAPSAEKLADDFKPLGDEIIRDSRSGATGWSDRLIRMADKVVTIRPVDEAGATGVPGGVARIEDALTRGDVAAAVTAWDALPEPSRRISEEWARQAKQRAEADAAARNIASEALATLNRTAP